MIPMEYRIEKDFIGEKEVPKEAYYGIQTLRAVENFPITGVAVHMDLFKALAQVKKAAARANMSTHLLTTKIGDAIIKACDDVIEGKFDDQFIVDSIQGGAGTSINMNMNEVLANRALELLEKEKGDYFWCSPNTHVNMSQSTNDTVPTAIRISAYLLTQELLASMQNLFNTLQKKSQEFDAIVKPARTHLQDAVPIRFGQEFNAYSNLIRRDHKRIQYAAEELLSINMGATAVGTGINAKLEYTDKVTTYLKEQLNLPVHTAEDLVDATQNTDMYTTLSASLKVCAVNVSKICNDLRLLASGPRTGLHELILPPRQPGSSIMPGKVNPVMVEVMNQVSFQVMGNDLTICVASEAGQLELNVMGPVMAFNLLQSIQIMKNGMDVLEKFALRDLKVNEKKCREYVEHSFIIVTALNPHLGYETSSYIVKEALQSGKTVKEICLEHQYLSEEELTEILSPYEMTTPGIAGYRFLEEE